eukprot:6491948-Amphidinium_carterae.1
MKVRQEMHNMREAHEMEKQNITNQAMERIRTMGDEMRALQQQRAVAPVQGALAPDGDRNGGTQVTLELVQQLVAQQVSAQTRVLMSAAAPPPPPPPHGHGVISPPGLGGRDSRGAGVRHAGAGGAPPPPPPPGDGGQSTTCGQGDGHVPRNSGMSVHFQGHGGQPGDEPDGGPEGDSDSDAARTPRGSERRREAAKVELPELPAPAGFRTWKTNAFREICGCSSDPQRAFTWLSEIDSDLSDDVINTVKAKWRSLDGKIAAAIGRIMKGTLLRRVNTKIESLARLGRFAAGRLVMRWLIQDFAVDNSRGALYDISDLMQLKLTGSSASAIQNFLEAWNWVEQGLKSDVAPRVKEAMLWHQLKDCHILEPELVLYRTAPEGTEWRSYEYLLRSVESYVKRNRQDATRDEVLKGIQHLGGGAGQAYAAEEPADALAAGGKKEDKKKHCWAWEKGECKRGAECKFLHEPQKKGSRKTSRSATPTRSPGPGNKPACLAWAKTGKCSYGDRCRYAHDATPSAVYKGSCEDISPPNLSTSSVRVTSGKCISEICVHVEEELMTTGVEDTELQCLSCDIQGAQRRWICDSGAGIDLIGRKSVWTCEQESMKFDIGERKLRTANGTTTADSSVVCDLESLNMSLNPLVLDECPPVMSLGRRIAQGFKFVWDKEECTLITPNGGRVELQVENHVPVLIQEVTTDVDNTDERLKSEGYAYAGEEEITGSAGPSEPDGHDGSGHHDGDMAGERDEEEEEETEELPSKIKYMQHGRRRDAAQHKIHRMIHFPKNKHCECCSATRFQNKQARRVPDDERTVKAERFGDMLHLDHVFTNGEFVGCHGERCALLIIDEATRFCFMYPAKEKSAENVVSALRHFIGTDVEWQRIGVKSDNALEYSKACRDLGLAWYESTPNRHESNGMIERLIRTVSDVTRTVLHQSGLGHPFWSIAGPTAAMMMNIFVPNEVGELPWLMRRGGKAFPHAAWCFGARVRCLIPGKMADKRPKFMSKGAPCLFAGWHWSPGFVHADYQVINEEQLKIVDEASAVHVHRVAEITTEEPFLFPLGGEGVERNRQEVAVLRLEHIDHEGIGETTVEGGEGAEKEGGIHDLLTRQQTEAGWRVDRFGSRIVKVPPRSTRPPAFDPESWQSLPYSVRRAVGKRSGERDSREARASTDTMVTIPLERKRVHFEGEGEERTESGEAINISDVNETWMESHIEKQIFVELCCNVDSVFGRRAISGVCVIRVTEEDDLHCTEVQEKICTMAKMWGKNLWLWVSTPCTTGCTWHRTNAAYVQSREYKEKHARNTLLAEIASQCMDVVMHYEGNVAWEWPRGNDMWRGQTGEHILRHEGCVEVVFDGCSFATCDREGKLIKKPWKVVTNCVELWQELRGRVCNNSHEHGQCRGRTATASGGYSDGLADCVMSVVRQVHHKERNSLSRLGDEELAFQVHDAVAAELEEWLSAATVPKAHTRYNLRQDGMVSRSVLLGAYCRRGIGVTNATRKGKWARALELIHELAKRRVGERSNQRYLSIQVNSYDSGESVPRHRDKFNEGLSDIYVCGQFEGGDLYCNEQRVDAIGKWGTFNGKEWHWTEPHRGRRISIVLFTPQGWEKLSNEHMSSLADLGFPVQEQAQAIPCNVGEEVQEETCCCMDRVCSFCGQCFVGDLVQKNDALDYMHDDERNGDALTIESEEECPPSEVGSHRTREPDHDPPLWGLVTRQISQKDPEYHSKECQAALREEHEKLLKRGVWDTSTVCELNDLYGDRSQEDFLVGQVFPIMGEKFAEEGAQHRQYKARIVFAGNRVRTKSGCDPVDLYTEMSNSPTTLAAARACIGAGLSVGQVVSVRDVSQAYIQCLLDLQVKTWVELPKCFWPPEWYDEQGRARYSRPCCVLVKALYGHPVSGGAWERHLGRILKGMGWSQVHGLSGVWMKPVGEGGQHATLAVYVDDLLLTAPKEFSEEFWNKLGKELEFKDPAGPLERYLGANHVLSKQGSCHTMSVHMKGYIDAAVHKFASEWGHTLQKVHSPYVGEDEEESDCEGDLKFEKSASSHIATLLFLARVCRPDLMVAVCRLAKKVSRWEAIDDKKLVRLFAYLKGSRDLVTNFRMLEGSDFHLAVWSDADLAGDVEDTKSTSGAWIELLDKRGNSWPISWLSKKQGASAYATCESETIALNTALREEGIPILDLLCSITGREIKM